MIVKANYRGSASSALGGADPISNDKERFLSNARGAYQSARQAPHVDVLAKYGFTASRFSAVEENLNLFATRDGEFKQADRIAARTTVERDEAATELVRWVATFRKLARIGLRRRPDLIAALGV